MIDALKQKLDAVCDETTFVAFVRFLAADRAAEVKMEQMTPSPPYGSGTNGWENGSIESFLEAAAAWAEDWKSSPQYCPPANPWNRCAQILYAGKFYE